jgi:hypothetical protein
VTTVHPPGERQREDGRPRPEDWRSSPVAPPESVAQKSLGVVLVLALLLSAVVAALVVAKLVKGPATPRARSTTAPTTSTTVAPVKAAENAAVEPGFTIHPQRARVGAPIRLDLRGTGCAGGVGDVTITQIGTAKEASTQDRLVLRTRFDIDAAGSWSTAPVLVDQPAGTYRVTASCGRRAVAEDLQPADERRDVFVATESLELTAPTGEERFEVFPATPPAHVAVTVTAQGFQRCPAGAQVTGKVVPTPGTPSRTRDFAVVVAPDSHWSVPLSFSASEAVSTYSVSARCSSGFDFANEVIEFAGS